MPAPLPPFPFVESLLWCMAGLMLAYIFLPFLFMMLGQSRVTFVILGGPESAQPDDDEPRSAELYEWLRDLGFEPLGSRREIGWFAGHWYKRHLPGRIWATPGRDCFVSLYRLFPEERWRLAFSTVFDDGSVVQTANQMTQLRIEESDYLRWACPSPDLGEVLRQHRLAAEEFAAGRGRVVAAPDLPEMLERLCHHSERYLRKQGPTQGLNALKLPLVLFVVAIAGSTYYFDFGNWTAAAAVILAGAVYKLLLPSLRRGAARKLRDEDQERGLAQQWANRRRAAARVTSDAPRAPSNIVAAPGRQTRDDDGFTRDPRP